MLLGNYRLLAYVDDEDLLVEIKARPHVGKVFLCGVSRNKPPRSPPYPFIGYLLGCCECIVFVVGSGLFCCPDEGN